MFGFCCTSGRHFLEQWALLKNGVVGVVVVSMEKKCLFDTPFTNFFLWRRRSNFSRNILKCKSGDFYIAKENFFFFFALNFFL